MVHLYLSPVCLSVNQFCIQFPCQCVGLSVLTCNSHGQKTTSSPPSVYLTVTRRCHLPPPSPLLAVCFSFQPVCRSVGLCHSVSPSCHFLVCLDYPPVHTIIRTHTRIHTHIHTHTLSLSLSSSIAIPEKNRLVWQWVVYVHEPGDTLATAALICSSQRQVGTAARSEKSKCLNENNACTIAHVSVRFFVNYKLVLADGRLQRCQLTALVFHLLCLS